MIWRQKNTDISFYKHKKGQNFVLLTKFEQKTTNKLFIKNKPNNMILKHFVVSHHLQYFSARSLSLCLFLFYFTFILQFFSYTISDG